MHKRNETSKASFISTREENINLPIVSSASHNREIQKTSNNGGLSFIISSSFSFQHPSSFCPLELQPARHPFSPLLGLLQIRLLLSMAWLPDSLDHFLVLGPMETAMVVRHLLCRSFGRHTLLRCLSGPRSGWWPALKSLPF